MLDHVVGLKDLMYVDHGFPSGLDSVHLVEDVLSLTSDLYSLVLSDLGDLVNECEEVNVHLLGVHDHHHVEDALDDGLGNVENVDVLLCEIGADACDDTDGVLADDGYDGSVHFIYFYKNKKSNPQVTLLYCFLES